MKGNDNLKKYLKRTEGISSRRVLMTALMALAVLVIGAVLVAGVCLKEQALTTDFTRKNIAPCIQYPFGTDWMGRDMFVRTVAGLSLSIRIGLLTAAVSAVMALMAYTPFAIMVLISAWIPAPPLESLPAMVNAVFIFGFLRFL